MPHQASNSTGFLPNDQPHVVKLSAAYSTRFGAHIGLFGIIASGTPINEFGAGPGWSWIPTFLSPRGSAGRTPHIWNLDLRLAYDLPMKNGASARLQLDLLHMGNPRRVVQVDERHYNTLDTNGEPATPNPQYKSPLEYQPPMAARLAIEVRL
jgi:hypothetical protein